ncbi:MAG: adenylosuccinate lyase [Peptoniphilaceae bacterium]|nr:adenylosuccinate lyase [Peptoniphilaceae bacterium]MDY6019642.1 adenylosuccinate lyase [Anaerococcus sp.]
MDRNIYQNPLITRYASYEMSNIFSEQVKFETFRRLWLALAKAEKDLGLDISDEQIKELEDNISNIDFDKASKYEKELRHDVMAHIRTYADAAPKAGPIIHLGATSCYVTDNTDIILTKKALDLVEKKLAILISHLSKFALKYKDLPSLGYTHFQPAQLVTVGKRACLWIQDFLLDLIEIKYRKDKLMLRGVKGTTGTQASFLDLFDGDGEKVKELNNKVVESFGFKKSIAISGQTYTRKIDYQVVQALAGIAQSAHKMTNDIRLLQNRKELEEPFEKTQVGSSAMAYKRNPMRSERISSLSKYVISLSMNPQLVAATQWLERTLDDSANKRMTIPEAFMAVDAILEIAINVSDGIVVYENQIKAHINEELPFMATENILMEAVKKGGDRQKLHEKIREYSMIAAKRVKEEGKNNNLLELLEKDEDFGLDKKELDSLLDASLYIGRCPEQVVEFIKEEVEPLIKEYNTDYRVDLKV